jgi:hypothetical protein
MWNFKLKFEPVEIIGMLVVVEQETNWSLRTSRPVGWVAPPYDSIPFDLLAYECFRLMHTLVTDTKPKVWHNAVEEALLYGVCKTLVTYGRRGKFIAEIRQTVNSLRLRAGLKPIRDLKRMNEDSWEIDVLDSLLFSDRDWEMASAAMILHPELRERMSIHDHYFDVYFRKPAPNELSIARSAFQEIITHAKSGQSARGLPMIPPLHQT